MKKIARKLTGRKKPFDIDGDGRVTMADFAAIFTGKRYKETSSVDFVRDRASEIWGKNEHHFTLLSLRIQKRQTEIRSFAKRLIFGGKDSKIDKIIRNLLVEMNDDEVNGFQNKYEKSISDIAVLEGKLAELNASSVMANSAETPKIKRAKDKFQATLDKYREEQNILVCSFKKRLDLYGMVLTDEQAEVLLTRIDSRDIVKITCIFAIVQTLTAQLAHAKLASGENLDVTKKYYGVYIGLLELQETAQTAYLEMIDQTYLPGVNKIRIDALELKEKTQSQIANATSAHIGGYESNLESQDYTIKVTKEYETILIENKNKISQARDLVRQLIELAENTLSTVRVSSDLANLIQRSETLIDQVITLQAPDLVPFENLELKKEFENVTSRIRNIN